MRQGSHAEIDKPELGSYLSDLTQTFLCQVRLGPTFIFVVQGTAVEPCLDFSFTKFNFGKCFLYSPGMVPACQTLVMTNKGIKGIRCLFLSATESQIHKENV